MRYCINILILYTLFLLNVDLFLFFLKMCKFYATIVSDITNFCFRLLPKPYTEAFAEPKTKFLMSLTIKENSGVYMFQTICYTFYIIIIN